MRVSHLAFAMPHLCTIVRVQVRQGFYIEMGAFNGHTYSNTKFFHDTLDWRGLLIEPAPNAYVCQSDRPAYPARETCQLQYASLECIFYFPISISLLSHLCSV